MSALGQKRTLERIQSMSALPPKADVDHHGRDVCFVPQGDIGSPSVRSFCPRGNLDSAKDNSPFQQRSSDRVTP
jgi:hypothetical protein